jgi:hypothetical protein
MKSQESINESLEIWSFTTFDTISNLRLYIVGFEKISAMKAGFFFAFEIRDLTAEYDILYRFATIFTFKCWTRTS